MITFTKEQLIASAHARIEFAEMMLAGELEPLKERTWSIELELARIALASLEAEAVHQFIYNNPYEEGYTEWLDCNEDYFNGVPEDCRRILHTAPPAPVSAPDELSREEYKRRFMEEDNFDDTFRGGWNACRSAMLQGASGNSQVIPDGLRLALSNAGIAAPESDEMLAATCEKYIQALVTWVKDRKPFRSAVIPDGWVACSERMPERGVDVLACTISPIGGFEEIETAQWHGGMKCNQPVFITSADTIEPTHWMPLPAAPQQEVK